VLVGAVVVVLVVGVVDAVVVGLDVVVVVVVLVVGVVDAVVVVLGLVLAVVVGLLIGPMTGRLPLPMMVPVEPLPVPVEPVPVLVGSIGIGS